MRPARHDVRAFTLIEIMMVVAIVGLTMVMGLPSFLRVLKREGMGKAEYELLDACHNARRAAIMNNQTTDLIFHPIDGTFEVPGAFEQTRLPDDVTIDILGVNFNQLEKADVAQVQFFPNGMSDEFSIVLRGADGSVCQISLDTVTALPHLTTIK